MNEIKDVSSSILQAWKLNNGITTYLIERLPDAVWAANVPGYQRKTIQMICGHLHNTRCMWLKEIGPRFGISIPDSVDRYNVSKSDLIQALHRSSNSIIVLLENGMKSSKNLPGFSLDAVHFENYLVAHEANHRGQIIMAARQLGQKLPDEVAYGVWKWSNLAKGIE